MVNDQTSKMLILTQRMFFVDASFWLVFGALGFVQSIKSTCDLRFILSVLMIANAAVLTWFGVVIIRAKSFIFFLAILYMTLNVILSVTDQFGWIDAVILLLNLVVLGLLIITRRHMKQIGDAASREI